MSAEIVPAHGPSWKPLALDIIEAASRQLPLEGVPLLRDTLDGVRRELDSTRGDPDEKLFDKLTIGAARAQIEGKVLADHEAERNIRVVCCTVQAMVRRMRMVRDLYLFQRRRIASRDRGLFPRVSAKEMRAEFPDYFPTLKDPATCIRELTGTSKDALLAAMGFPVIADFKNKEELRKKLSSDIWRAYNEKNGLPLENRTYRRGTQFPTMRESLYHQTYFERAYGSFSNAVRTVILGSAVGDGVEVVFEDRVNQILKLSLEKGRVPTAAEVGCELQEFSQVESYVRSRLETDLMQVISSFLNPFKRQRLAPVNYPFKVAHLLVATNYLRQYGIRIYRIWFSREQLEILIAHRSKLVEDRLHDVFFDEQLLAHMRGVESLVDTSEDAVKGLRKRTAIRKMIRLFSEHPKIPFYMRQVLLSRNTRPKSVERRIARFRAAGIPEDFYVHFLHIDNRFDKVIRKLKYEVACFKPVEAGAKRVASVQADDVEKGGNGKAWSPARLVELSAEACRRATKKTVKRRSRRFAMIGEDPDQELLEKFLADRQIDLPPPYLADRRPGLLLEKIRFIEARGVPFKVEYWWWLNASAAQMDVQIEHEWKSLSVDNRRKELVEIYDLDEARMHERLKAKEPDLLRSYCKVLCALGYDVMDYQWLIIHNPLERFCDEIARRLKNKKKKEVLSSKEGDWLARQGAAKKLRRLNGDGLFNGVSVQALVDVATTQEIGELRKIKKYEGSDVEKNPLVENLSRRAVDRERVEMLLRRYRLGYADMDYFTENDERVEFTLRRIAQLEKLKEPISRETLAGEWNEETLTDEQRRVRQYLNNLGCSPLWAEKLARSGVTLDELCLRVAVFTTVELDSDDYGKVAFDTVDYEDFLDRPLVFCRRYGVGRAKRKLANQYARQRLISAIGFTFDHERGWAMQRTTTATMWKKFKFLSSQGVIRDEVVNNPKLITLYSKFSLAEVASFVRELAITLKDRNIPAEDQDLYLQVALRVLHGIAVISHSGIIQTCVVAKAKEEFLSGKFKEYIPSLKDRAASANSQAYFEEMIARSTVDIYEKLVRIISSEEIGGFGGDVPAEEYPGVLTSEQEIQLGRLKDRGDKKALDTLVVKNIPLVVFVARKYAWSNLPIADLIQEGNLGLMEAAEKFDYRRGFKFSTYAAWWIRSYIGRYIANHSRGVRLPVHLHHLLFRAKGFVADFIKTNRRRPTMQEISEGLGVTTKIAEKLEEMLFAGAGLEVSMDANLAEDEGKPFTRMDGIGVVDSGTEEMVLNDSREKFLRALKSRVFKKLKYRDKQMAWNIFVARFGFGQQDEEFTLGQLGKKYGLSGEMIRQIEGYVLDVIKNDPELVGILKDLVT